MTTCRWPLSLHTYLQRCLERTGAGKGVSQLDKRRIWFLDSTSQRLSCHRVPCLPETFKGSGYLQNKGLTVWPHSPCLSLFPSFFLSFFVSLIT